MPKKLVSKPGCKSMNLPTKATLEYFLSTEKSTREIKLIRARRVSWMNLIVNDIKLW